MMETEQDMRNTSEGKVLSLTVAERREKLAVSESEKQYSQI